MILPLVTGGFARQRPPEVVREDSSALTFKDLFASTALHLFLEPGDG
jgi:hypothetical protein